MNNQRKICPICRSKKYTTTYRSTTNLSNDLNIKIFSARRLPDKIHGTIVRCKRCGLVRSLEIIGQTKLSELYAKSKFTYNNITDNLESSYIKIIKNATIGLDRKKIKILEVGCGNGFLLAKAKEVGYKNVSGIEPSRDAISRSPKTIRKNIVLGMLNEGSFPPKSFDIICAFQVFDHIPDPNVFLKTCHSFLKPGGKIVLMNHDVESWSARFLGERSPIFDIEHTYLYSPKTIKKILINNSFKIQKIYSPPAYMTLKYILRLLPIPQIIKKKLINLNLKFLETNVKLYPGNVCAIAIKK